MNIDTQTMNLIKQQFQKSGSEEQLEAVVTAIVSLLKSPTKMSVDNQQLALFHIAKAMSGSDDASIEILNGALRHSAPH